MFIAFGLCDITVHWILHMQLYALFTNKMPEISIHRKLHTHCHILLKFKGLDIFPMPYTSFQAWCLVNHPIKCLVRCAYFSLCLNRKMKWSPICLHLVLQNSDNHHLIVFTFWGTLTTEADPLSKCSVVWIILILSQQTDGEVHYYCYCVYLWYTTVTTL